MQSHSWILVFKYYFIWDLTHFVLCHQYTFYIAHMETELKSHSFQHQTLGSYANPIFRRGRLQFRQKIKPQSTPLLILLVVLGLYINIATYLQSTYSIPIWIWLTLTLIYRFNPISNAYWVHTLHKCGSSFTYLSSIAGNENVRLYEILIPPILLNIHVSISGSQ